MGCCVLTQHMCVQGNMAAAFNVWDQVCPNPNGYDSTPNPNPTFEPCQKKRMELVLVLAHFSNPNSNPNSKP